jgi:glycine/D-amino acid oxidase-like deaminating enzyme/nitrite reductase/ring-hydroxylating ferredoxin subunit
MHSTRYQSRPLWAPPEPLLGELGPVDTRWDVCVIGAGIAGLTTAYLLSREKRRVVVVDNGPVGGGESERTTAHLASALDDRFFELEKLHGPEGARQAAQSHSAAIDQIELIQQREGIACDFARLDGFLFVPPGEPDDILDRELEAARRAGLEVQMVSASPLHTFNTGPCLRFSRQGQFHPTRYLRGVLDACRRNGVRLFTGIHVTGVDDGRPAMVHIRGREEPLRASEVVVATNTPINDRFKIHTKQAPYRTYVIAASIPKGAIPPALYWDTADPYHYVRMQAGEEQDYLIVGGEDHKTGQDSHPSRHWENLEAWMRPRFFQAGKVEFRWSGQIMEPVDCLAFIGRNPGDHHVYIATGDSGHGMTHGTLAGMLISDLILDRENPWEKLYDPSRVTLQATGEFSRENLNVVKQYTDYVRSGDQKPEHLVAPGEARVVRRGLKRVALYREPNGTLHEMSAVCPHLGCVVHWNDAEQSWDCPCHGSRFTATGEVLNGPAVDGLKEVDQPVHVPVSGPKL